MSLCILAVIIVIVLLWIFYYYRKNKHDFNDWKIPQPPEYPFLGIVGTNVRQKLHLWDSMKILYNFNKDAKYIGIHAFMTPQILVRDLDLIKTIMIKDFDHFSNRKEFLNDEQDPLLTKNLFNINGDKWREVRSLLSPAFTANKMKMMFELMLNCADRFTQTFKNKFSKEDATDMQDAFRRYTNDVIASCAFGIEIDSLTNPKNEFFIYGKQVNNSEGYAQVIALIKATFILTFPKLARALNVKLLSKKMSNFFVNVIDTTIKMRYEKNITRPDMLQLLMESRNTKELDIVDIAANAFLFFVAGFETAATQMSLMAHKIAVNPDVQEKLQAEIDAASEATNGKVSYEAISNMTYLNAIFQETLRLHPQVAIISRTCSKDYELPPTLSGSKPFVVKPGLDIIIPASAIQRDPDLYEEPDKFNPDRFVGKKMPTSDPTSLGFGIGPRMCIGNRFAILETKVLFFHLLRQCNLTPCSNTCIPLKYSRKRVVPIPEEGFWLKVNKR